MALLSRQYSDAGYARAAISAWALTLCGTLLMLKSGADLRAPAGAARRQVAVGGVGDPIITGRFLTRPTLAAYFLTCLKREGFRR